MNAQTRQLLRFACYGVGLGFSLHHIGFTDYRELHAMLVFEDLRMLASFGAAALLLLVGMRYAARGRARPHRPIHRGTVPGALLFGAGWVLSGACPGVIFAQLGEGYWPALVSGAGLLLGMFLYERLRPRFFRWSTGSCE